MRRPDLRHPQRRHVRADMRDTNAADSTHRAKYRQGPVHLSDFHELYVGRKVQKWQICGPNPQIL
jgi:hypothetical protein